MENVTKFVSFSHHRIISKRVIYDPTVGTMHFPRSAMFESTIRIKANLQANSHYHIKRTNIMIQGYFRVLFNFHSTANCMRIVVQRKI